MKPKQPTVYDVAQHAGVSIATVSRVLRGPQSVRQSTRERVLQSVHTLGYVPSASARGLAGRRTKVLGLLFPGETQRPAETLAKSTTAAGIEFIDDRGNASASSAGHLYFDELIQGAEDAAWHAGYALMVAAGRDMSESVALDDVTGRVDALAVLAQTIDDTVLARAARRVPLVVLAGDRPTNADRVNVDNEGGMRLLTQHVLSVKHPGPILYLDGPKTSPDANARRAGFLEATSGQETHIVSAEFNESSGRAITTEFLAHTQPGAIVAANDQSALGALTALTAAGISVPGDCVVTGFDGIDASRYSTPPLTTVRQPMVLLGKTAMETLVNRLQDPDREPRAIELPVDILLRESCPPTEPT
ncbi:MAG TPA: LacI family DNA-binding transcriptional regulator [Ruania sp.]|nr:LacI family DNA-binding transcriptional regulator [Ruania sp.]